MLKTIKKYTLISIPNITILNFPFFIYSSSLFINLIFTSCFNNLFSSFSKFISSFTIFNAAACANFNISISVNKFDILNSGIPCCAVPKKSPEPLNSKSFL